MNRLSEPSTYSGLASLAIIFGIEVGQFEALANALAVLFSALAVILRELHR